MKPRFDYGTSVRLIRNVRNDGTYPGEDVGKLLVRRGEVGAVYDVGSYLQDQVIYRVHFLEAGRTVGCREEELILASDPWVRNQFEFRDRVIAKKCFAVNGEVLVEQGTEGEIERVIKEAGSPVCYHVRFNQRVYLIPEHSLLASENQPPNQRAVRP